MTTLNDNLKINVFKLNKKPTFELDVFNNYKKVFSLYTTIPNSAIAEQSSYSGEGVKVFISVDTAKLLAYELLKFIEDNDENSSN